MFILGQKESSLGLNLALPVKGKSCIEREDYIAPFSYLYCHTFVLIFLIQIFSFGPCIFVGTIITPKKPRWFLDV